MDGPTLCRLAYRTQAFKGVMRLRAEMDAADKRDGASPSRPAATSQASRGSAAPADSDTTYINEATLKINQDYAGLIDWAQV